MLLYYLIYKNSWYGNSHKSNQNIQDEYYNNLTKKKIAEIACRIEINILKKPIGMQDQYIAAYGGLNWINFKSKKSFSFLSDNKLFRDVPIK